MLPRRKSDGWTRLLSSGSLVNLSWILCETWPSTMADHDEIESPGPNLVPVIVTFLCLATISVIVRLVARLRYVKNAGADDVTIVMAWVS